MKLILRALIALTLTTTLPAYAAYQVEVDAPSDVSSLLNTHLDIVRYKNRTDLSDEQVRFMIETVNDQVESLLATEGYFSPKTDVVISEADDRIETVKLSIQVGERTHIKRTDIQVTGPIQTQAPDLEKSLVAQWPLAAGEPFTQSAWSSAKDKLLVQLHDKRYPAAHIKTSRAAIYPETASAELTVDYDSGPLFTLGPLQISGLKRYPAAIIENVNPLALGEDYSVSRLQALQQQIQNTPYFSNVVVSVNDNPENAELAPVQVHVNEYPTQRTRLGVGYASDTGAQLESRYTYYNMFDRAWVFDGQAKLEQRRQYGALELAMPPDRKSYVNSIASSMERTTLQGIDLRNFRMGLERSRSAERYDTSYLLTYYRDQLEQDDGAALPDPTVTAPGKHQALVLGFKWARRDVDNPIFPMSGDLFSIEAGVAVQGVVTDQTFTRVYSRYKRYIPVLKRDIIIARAEFGGVFSKGSANEVPASLLFRAGGSDSVRGYNYQSIGNRIGGTVYPAKYLMIASLEYQHWFKENWAAAVFYDVGSAANSLTDRTLYKGTGVGARWKSPVGILQFDIAYGIENKSIRPHISLGIAF
jgi:translocation and assembly module TamA